ncbi:PspC domain-containing protein [Paenibacillus sp. TRM 82003]|uniref:ATP-binding protein n=1 Tax=Kineococcus sp. TRM81007 TaxID=2925831 RepID=UPI001F59E65F|nr:ATP-binding protein [Kineococcus sp. TRM81007]MCI2237969.1 PspC domain-containing protein [Kineococcus sp. TRM81007]MCI3925984.1 PspC domain-containing protein [Paenibacillus sp. TRM 82003]
MSTSATADAGPAAPPGSRTRLVRPATGRRAGGVAAGLAAHLDVPVNRVRVAFLALAVLAGTGVALYAAYWFLVPDERDVGTGGRRADPSAWVLAHRDALVGAALVLAGAAAALQVGGVDASSRVVLPVLVVGAGVVLAWSQLDATRRARWAGAGDGRTAALRVAAGTSLVLLGVVLLLVLGGDAAALGGSVLGALAVLAGVAVVLAPWAVRLWQDLGAERAALAREQERAELAAHVHDSVLQTLALIQRRSGDAVEVARLARAQERDLRRWLYGDHGTAAGTLGAALRSAAAEVEDASGATVEVVLVGDVDGLALDRGTSALAQAAREALLNAGRHAGGTVSLYAESLGSGDRRSFEVFVRDRGPGFDLDAVPQDRLGVRESILGRMARAGGSASVRRPADGGTEVVLRLPAPAAEGAAS